MPERSAAAQAFAELHVYEQRLVLACLPELHVHFERLHAAHALVAAAVSHGGRQLLVPAVVWGAVLVAQDGGGDPRADLLRTMCATLSSEQTDTLLAFQHDVFVWDLCVFHCRCTRDWCIRDESPMLPLDDLRAELAIARAPSRRGALQRMLYKLLVVYFAAPLAVDSDDPFAPALDGDLTIPAHVGTHVPSRIAAQGLFAEPACCAHAKAVGLFLSALDTAWAPPAPAHAPALATWG